MEFVAGYDWALLGKGLLMVIAAVAVHLTLPQGAWK